MTTVLDLDYDDGQQAIAHALAEFCREECDADTVKAASGEFPTALWSQLADLGMLAIGTPEGDGGACELAAAMESLGAAVFPGPLVSTYLAGQLLDAPRRVALVEGKTIVSAGTSGLMPWAPRADLFLEIVGDRVFEAQPQGEIVEVATLGGEPWGRVTLVRGSELAGGARALVFADIALSAYLAAAGTALVAAASEHAATRSQFGRAIGEFQAVAHPLADCSMRLSAATALVRSAAFLFDAPDAEGEASSNARVRASAARLSANAAALDAAYVCHQVFGANGITLEGPVFHISRRIRQLVSQPPGDAGNRSDMLDAIALGTSGV